MNRTLIVSASPHVGSKLTSQKIMLHVIIALLFPLAAGVYFYGFYALLVVGISTAAAVLSELLFNLATKKPITIKDLSAVVSGMIFGLNLPPRVPLYIPVVGAIFAIMVVKMLFGGLGKNFANPAAAARVFVMLSWAAALGKFMAPLDYSNGFFAAFFGFETDIVTSATPLAALKELNLLDINLLDLFLGKIGGSIGEGCSVAIIVSAIYLFAFRIIDYKITLTYIGVSALFALIFYGSLSYVLPTLLSGGLLFGAVFMLTDYATSPVTTMGKIIFALGAAILTVLVRRYGGFNEGTVLSVLFMNLLVPFLDRIKPKAFGFVKTKRTKKGAENGKAQA